MIDKHIGSTHEDCTRRTVTMKRMTIDRNFEMSTANRFSLRLFRLLSSSDSATPTQQSDVESSQRRHPVSLARAHHGKKWHWRRRSSSSRTITDVVSTIVTTSNRRDLKADYWQRVDAQKWDFVRYARSFWLLFFGEKKGERFIISTISIFQLEGH